MRPTDIIVHNHHRHHHHRTQENSIQAKHRQQIDTTTTGTTAGRRSDNNSNINTTTSNSSSEYNNTTTTGTRIMNSSHYCYYAPLLLMAFSLMVNLCTAEAFVPKNNPNNAFIGKSAVQVPVWRGGESVGKPRSTLSTSSSSSRRQEKNTKYEFQLREFLGDDSPDEASSSSSVSINGPSSSSSNGMTADPADDSSVKKIRLSTSKVDRLGATRMPPRHKNNNNGMTKKNNNNTINMHSMDSNNINNAKNSNSNNNVIQNNNPNVDSVLAQLEDKPVPAEFIAETALPTDIGHFRLRAYRTACNGNEYTGREPSVIYAADKSPFGVEGQLQQDVPVRIHDQCLTSEVFGSKRYVFLFFSCQRFRMHPSSSSVLLLARLLVRTSTASYFCYFDRLFISFFPILTSSSFLGFIPYPINPDSCDCSEQLRMALKHIAQEGGVIIYLQQEGRGIGLANKIAAYALQDVGMDTVDANLHLGFPDDCRHYGAVPSILHDMMIGSIQLMTNNPYKVNRLKELGVKVSNTLSVVVPTTNPYNHRYLLAKHERMDHQNLRSLLSTTHETETTEVDEVEGMIVIDETIIREGEDMAANAIEVSLALSDENYEGVLAEDNGYCFGRQSVEDAIQAMKEKKMVVVVDDMNRENEGDLIMAADACTPEDMAFIVRYSSGVICIAMDGDRMDKLGLPPMLANNEDPKETAFTVTVDATKEHGISTGISSTDRAKTVNLLASPEAKSLDFARPGHIFPLRARDGGVLERDGHTEAAVDLSHLAGRERAGILCEIVSEENPIEMMRLPELKRFCKEHGLVLTSIVDLAQYRKDTENVKNDDDDNFKI